MFDLLCDGADMAVLKRQLCRMLRGVDCSKFNEHIPRQRKTLWAYQKLSLFIQPAALYAIYLSDIEKQLHSVSSNIYCKRCIANRFDGEKGLL